MKSIEVASRKLFFEDIQPERRQPTATVLFVHGAGGSHVSWRSQLESLTDKFRIIAVDLPGHGMSAGAGEATIQGYAGYVESLMDALGLENVILGGHSMGGAIALEIALNGSHKLGGLLLVGTGAKLRVLPAIFSMIRDDFEVAIESMGNFLFGPGVSKDILDEHKRLIAETTPEVLILDFTACDSFDIMDELSAISLPTLILCGKDDRLTPAKYSELLHAKIDGSEAVFFDDSGHMPMVEQSAAFNKAVESFLTRLHK
jgi:pimeloyl-ACP methyl ester carboxylesterase